MNTNSQATEYPHPTRLFEKEEWLTFDESRRRTETIAEMWLEREVLANQTQLIDELIKKESFDEFGEPVISIDDLANYGDDEIFQWWLVSDWLAGKLEEHGKPVLRNSYGNWWGRTTCGQSILQDGILQSIEKSIR